MLNVLNLVYFWNFQNILCLTSPSLTNRNSSPGNAYCVLLFACNNLILETIYICHTFFSSRHSKFYHKNLVKLFGVCSKHRPLYIVTELMPNGKCLKFFNDYWQKGAQFSCYNLACLQGRQIFPSGFFFSRIYTPMTRSDSADISMSIASQRNPDV